MSKSEFPFFESYHRSFQSLPPEIVGEVVLAMGSFYYDDTEIELEGIAKAVFDLIKPVIEKKKHISEVRSEASSGHGAPENNQNASKNQTKTNKNNQTTNKNQTNDNQKQTDKEIGVRSKDIGEKDTGDKEKDSPTESRKSNPPKHKYGKYQHVMLSDRDLELLYQNHGEEDTNAAIEYLDAYIDEKGYKSKNHKSTIERWVFDAIKKNANGSNRASPATNPKVHNFQERKYTQDDFSNFEQMFARN